MKLLLYCTKQPHKLYTTNEGYVLSDFELGEHYKNKEKLNGKIVAECDFEVEEIKKKCVDVFKYCYVTDTLNEYDLFYETQLDGNSMNNYLNGKGYAIHIKNLHIFDKPRDLRDYYTNRIYTKIEDVYTDEIQIKGSEWVRPIKQAPQNMMYAYDNTEKKILISIRPEWLCKILNGEKTIEVRKKVLKEMIK